jgi:hypothetical protein
MSSRMAMSLVNILDVFSLTIEDLEHRSHINSIFSFGICDRR